MLRNDRERLQVYSGYVMLVLVFCSYISIYQDNLFTCLWGWSLGPKGPDLCLKACILLLSSFVKGRQTVITVQYISSSVTGAHRTYE